MTTTLTLTCNTIRTIPNPQTMEPGDMGDAMRERAASLKAKLPASLAQAVDILLNMAAMVDALGEDMVTDLGKAELVADLHKLDALLTA